MSQEYGRSPLCILWCVFRSPLSLNDLLHTSQEYGRSPLCIYWCVFRLPLGLNDLLHMSHMHWHLQNDTLLLFTYTYLPSFTDDTPVYGRKFDTFNLPQKFPLNFHYIKNSHSASYHACILNSAIHNSCNGGAIYFQKSFLWFSCQSQWQPHTYYLK
jgi:hypothetical protein